MANLNNSVIHCFRHNLKGPYLLLMVTFSYFLDNDNEVFNVIAMIALIALDANIHRFRMSCINNKQQGQKNKRFPIVTCIRVHSSKVDRELSRGKCMTRVC